MDGVGLDAVATDAERRGAFANARLLVIGGGGEGEQHDPFGAKGIRHAYDEAWDAAHTGLTQVASAGNSLVRVEQTGASRIVSIDTLIA